MSTIHLVKACVLGFVITTGFAPADVFRFANSTGDGNWTNPANWINETSPEKPGVPDSRDEVRIGNAAVKLTTSVTVDLLKAGDAGAGVEVADGESATVVIDGGELLATGSAGFNSASYKMPGTLIIQNGGSASFGSYFMVGHKKTQGGSVIIHKGTLRVANKYVHNMYYEETDLLNTRTTINHGGLLEVGDLKLNAGLIDLAGGTLIIRRLAIVEVEEWVKAGLIIAMDGAEGWKISAAFDDITGWTTVVAEPLPGQQPFTVGALSPSILRPDSV